MVLIFWYIVVSGIVHAYKMSDLCAWIVSYWHKIYCF